MPAKRTIGIKNKKYVSKTLLNTPVIGPEKTRTTTKVTKVDNSFHRMVIDIKSLSSSAE